MNELMIIFRLILIFRNLLFGIFYGLRHVWSRLCIIRIHRMGSIMTSILSLVLALRVVLVYIWGCYYLLEIIIYFWIY